MNNQDAPSGAQRVRELLDAQYAPDADSVTQTVAGIVAATVDSTLRLSSVQLLVKGIDAETREILEKGIVQAVNRAMLKVVRTSPDAMIQSHESGEWTSTMVRLHRREMGSDPIS